MTARLFSVPLESASVGSLFCNPAAGSFSGTRSQRRDPGRISDQKSSDRSVRPCRDEGPELSLLWSNLLELLQEGIIVVSRSLKPIYWNGKAKEICQELSEIPWSVLELPTVISEVCHRLIRENHPTNHPLVLECRTSSHQTVRIKARWFDATAARGTGKVLEDDTGTDSYSIRNQEPYQHPYILVFIENCTDSLKEELRIEQKKYDLTDREVEVWMLLRQEYTYQEIAKMLQISLNTVKTHVKNVYAKRRSFQGQEKFWCSE
jgi:DNA-binding CsgD family transcriptional regulator